MTEQQNTQLAKISDNLKTMLKAKMDALPSNFNETRFMQNCLTVLSETKDIAKYDPRSVARTMLKGAFLGLDFFNRECYAIPYGNELTFQSDYRGEIKVCKRWSTNPIKDIYAKVVRKNDGFEAYIRNGKQVVNFNPANFSDEEVIGAFSVVYFQDGTMVYDTMSLKEINHIRTTYSKMPDGKAWKNSPEEMYKKTVIRRLCKLIDLDFDNADQRDAFNDGADADLKKIKDTIDVEHKVSDPFEKKNRRKCNKCGSEKMEEDADCIATCKKCGHRSDTLSPAEEDKNEEAVFKSSDPKKFAELKELFKDEEDWQTEARVKEANGANG